jgi:hypothetical protein
MSVVVLAKDPCHAVYLARSTTEELVVDRLEINIARKKGFRYSRPAFFSGND